MRITNFFVFGILEKTKVWISCKCKFCDTLELILGMFINKQRVNGDIANEK